MRLWKHTFDRVRKLTNVDSVAYAGVNPLNGGIVFRCVTGEHVTWVLVSESFQVLRQTDCQREAYAA